MTPAPTLRVLVAGYGLPAEFAVTALFGLGLAPQQVALLTHVEDERNRGLHAIARLRQLAVSTAPAKDEAATTFVQAFAPDLIFSVHYRSLIPARILEVARLGSLNLHPSLLPRYRGTNSVAWVIINGEVETGFSFHRMDAQFDTGAIVLQERIPIRADETAFSLFHRQIVRAMARMEEVIERMIAGYPGAVQPEDGGSYYPRALPFEGRIDPTWPDEQIERFIRAMIFPPFKPAVLDAGGRLQEVPDMATFEDLRRRFSLGKATG